MELQDCWLMASIILPPRLLAARHHQVCPGPAARSDYLGEVPWWGQWLTKGQWLNLPGGCSPASLGTVALPHKEALKVTAEYSEKGSKSLCFSRGTVDTTMITQYEQDGSLDWPFILHFQL